jgi:hypothetical protein
MEPQAVTDLLTEAGYARGCPTATRPVAIQFDVAADTSPPPVAVVTIQSRAWFIDFRLLPEPSVGGGRNAAALRAA